MGHDAVREAMTARLIHLSARLAAVAMAVALVAGCSSGTSLAASFGDRRQGADRGGGEGGAAGPTSVHFPTAIPTTTRTPAATRRTRPASTFPRCAPRPRCGPRSRRASGLTLGRHRTAQCCSAAYRDWKMQHALTLTTTAGGWGFDESFGGPRSDASRGRSGDPCVGTVATDGTIRCCQPGPGSTAPLSDLSRPRRHDRHAEGRDRGRGVAAGRPGLDERPPRTAGLRARRPRRIDAGSARTRDGPSRPRRRPNRARVAGPSARRRPDRRRTCAKAMPTTAPPSVRPPGCRTTRGARSTSCPRARPVVIGRMGSASGARSSADRRRSAGSGAARCPARSSSPQSRVSPCTEVCGARTQRRRVARAKSRGHSRSRRARPHQTTPVRLGARDFGRRAGGHLRVSGDGARLGGTP